MDKTIQEQLKQLYYSLGGNADNVRDTDDPGTIISAISALQLAGDLDSKYTLPEGGIPGSDLSEGVTDQILPFTITLTPTAEDLSGTMDKTPAEIWEAYDEGRRFVFLIPTMGAKLEATQFLATGESTCVSLAQVIYDISGQDALITITTSDDSQTYSTRIFPLTPLS